uniref:Interleukin 20 receptor subunit beta n=1 Tax=Leptobrachium leishanense TaxID=445787 RepID=A0A8C5M4H1_9ANUR
MDTYQRNSYGAGIMIAYMALIVSTRTENVTLPSPENITMTSVNLRHILSWNPLPADWKNVTYTVGVQGEYERTFLNDMWNDAEHCQSISAVLCNLTGDISTNVPYNLRVRAEYGNHKSDWALLGSFFRRNTSIFIPPNITLHNIGYQLIMDIEDLGPSFHYYAFYWMKGQEKNRTTMKIKKQTMSVYLTEVKPNNEYCAYAVAYAIGRNSSNSVIRCISVKEQKLSTLVIALMSLFAAVAGFVILSLLIWNLRKPIRFSCFPKVEIPEALSMMENQNSKKLIGHSTSINTENKCSHYAQTTLIVTSNET